MTCAQLQYFLYIVDFHMIKAKQGKVAWFLSKERTVRFVDPIPDFTHYYSLLLIITHYYSWLTVLTNIATIVNMVCARW